MEGIITRGTTLRGRAVNEGERVELNEDDYARLFSTGDITPIEVPKTEAPESEPSESSKPRKKK